jgi:hypothetical protein
VHKRLDEGKAADAIDKLVAMVERRLTTPAALDRFAKLATQHALSAVAEKLEDQYLGALPSQISDDVTARVLDTVERRMGKDTLPKISQKVTRHALQAVEKRLEAEDLAGLQARIQEETRQELEQNLETIRAEAVLAAVQAQPAAPADVGPAGESADVEAVEAIGARVSQVEEQLAGLDPADLPERVTERALEGFWAHLENAGLDGLPGRVVDELLAKLGTPAVSPEATPAPGAAELIGRVEALESSLLDMGTSVGEVETGARLDRLEELLRGVEARLSEGLTQAAQPAASPRWEVPFDSLEGRVRHLEETSDGGAEVSGGANEELGARLESLEQADLTRRLALLEQQVSRSGAASGEAEAALTSITRRISALESGVPQDPGSGSGLVPPLQETESYRLAELEDGLSALRERLARLGATSDSGDVPAAVEELSIRLATVEGTINAVTGATEQRLAPLKTRLAALESLESGSGGDVEGRLEELESRQEVALSALVDRVEALEAGKASDLAGQVAMLSQRVETLVPSEAFMDLLKRVTALEGTLSGEGDALGSRVAALEEATGGEDTDTLLRRLKKLERSMVELEMGASSGGAALERLEALEAQVASGGGGEPAGGGGESALADQLLALERRLGEFEMGAGSGTGAVEEIEALQTKVSLLEERVAEGGGSSGGFSEEFQEQVVQLALEQVRDRGEAQDDERVVRRVLEQLGPQLDERLGSQVDERLQGAQSSAPAGWQDEVERRVTAEVEEQLAMADLASVAEQATASAMRAVEAHLEESSDPAALAQRVDAALRDALQGLDVRQLAEKVAVQAVGPVMEAIDGRLQGVAPEDLQVLIEALEQRVDVLERGGYT